MPSSSKQVLELTAIDNASAVIKRVSSAAEGLTKSYDTLKNVLLGFVGGYGAAAFGQKIIDVTIAAEQANMRLAAVLRATGYSAGVSKAEMDALAVSLSHLTTFDEHSLRGGETALIKFGNITGDVFKRGLVLSADLAATMGTGVPEAAELLGRALNAPMEGMRGLSKEIGKLTPEQNLMIERLTRSNKALEAQNAILDIVQSRVGGVAKEMNTGLSGAMTSVTKEFTKLQEVLGANGTVLNNSLQGFAQLLHDIRTELEGERTPLSQLLVDTGNAMAFLGTSGLYGKMGDFKLPWTVGQFSVPPEKLNPNPRWQDKRWQDEYDAYQAQLQNFLKPPKLGGKPNTAGIDFLKGLDRKILESSSGEFEMLRLEAQQKFVSGAAAPKIDQLQKLKNYPLMAAQAVNNYGPTAKSIDDANDSLGEFNAKTSDQVRGLQLQAELLGKTAVEQQQLTAARELDRDVQTRVGKMNAENAGQIEQLYKAGERAKKLMSELIQANYEASRSWKSGVTLAMNEYVESATSAAEASRTLFLNTFKNMEDGLVKFVRIGKLNLADFVNSIADDFARIGIRQSITGPLAKNSGEFFDGLGESLFGGAHASGGAMPANTWNLVGEQGPEMVWSGAGGGNVIPNGALGSGDTYYIDARNASKEGLAQLAAAIRSVNGSIEARAVAAWQRAMNSRGVATPIG